MNSSTTGDVISLWDQARDNPDASNERELADIILAATLAPADADPSLAPVVRRRRLLYLLAPRICCTEPASRTLINGIAWELMGLLRPLLGSETDTEDDKGELRAAADLAADSTRAVLAVLPLRELDFHVESVLEQHSRAVDWSAALGLLQLGTAELLKRCAAPNVSSHDIAGAVGVFCSWFPLAGRLVTIAVAAADGNAAAVACMAQLLALLSTTMDTLSRAGSIKGGEVAASWELLKRSAAPWVLTLLGHAPPRLIHGAGTYLAAAQPPPESLAPLCASLRLAATLLGEGGCDVPVQQLLTTWLLVSQAAQPPSTGMRPRRREEEGEWMG
eukprot:SAG11_NODE_53_length_19648_cov_14.691902_1_plen_332_part_00